VAAGLVVRQALPERLRQELLARADAISAPPPAPAAVAPTPVRSVVEVLQPDDDVVWAPQPPTRRSRSSSWLPWAVALAATIAAVVVSLPRWRRAPAERVDAVTTSSPALAREELIAMAGTVVLPFAATEDAAARGASGDVVWHSGVQRGFMRISGLRRNDASREQYQLWVFDGTRDDRYPVDGGVFDIDESGDAIIPIRVPIPVRTATLFAVTVEKPGGVVVSSRERIVLAAK
jgi:anti-sigma-K factor RskA